MGWLEDEVLEMPPRVRGSTGPVDGAGRLLPITPHVRVSTPNRIRRYAPKCLYPAHAGIDQGHPATSSHTGIDRLLHGRVGPHDSLACVRGDKHGGVMGDASDATCPSYLGLGPGDQLGGLSATSDNPALCQLPVGQYQFLNGTT